MLRPADPPGAPAPRHHRRRATRSQAARFAPPPEFYSNELFQTDGQFDLQKYQQFLASPVVDDQLLLQLEAYYRELIPRNKLMQQVVAGAYIPEAELWRLWRDQHERVRVRYVAIDPVCDRSRRAPSRFRTARSRRSTARTGRNSSARRGRWSASSRSTRRPPPPTRPRRATVRSCAAAGDPRRRRLQPRSPGASRRTAARRPRAATSGPSAAAS